VIEPSPLPLPLGERGLRFGNLRKARALSFLVDRRSGGGVDGFIEEGGEEGELGGISMDEIEGLLRLRYIESLGGNGGGFEYELNLKDLKRESDVAIVVVVVVVPIQPAFDPTFLNKYYKILYCKQVVLYTKFTQRAFRSMAGECLSTCLYVLVRSKCVRVTKSRSR